MPKLLAFIKTSGFIEAAPAQVERIETPLQSFETAKRLLESNTNDSGVISWTSIRLQSKRGATASQCGVMGLRTFSQAKLIMHMRVQRTSNRRTWLDAEPDAPFVGSTEGGNHSIGLVFPRSTAMAQRKGQQVVVSPPWWKGMSFDHGLHCNQPFVLSFENLILVLFRTGRLEMIKLVFTIPCAWDASIAWSMSHVHVGGADGGNNRPQSCLHYYCIRTLLIHLPVLRVGPGEADP